ncbi:MAG: lamin tail domain-containing protein [Verrucomicrobiales bacterium]
MNILRLLRPAFLCGAAMWLIAPLDAQTVRINELVAATSDRLIRFDAAGRQRLGSGPVWYEAGYSDWFWESDPGPFGSSGVTALSNIPVSTYFRRTFQATAGQAASSDTLQLTIGFDDGFVAFLNGVEVARRNMGAEGTVAYHDQPAHNSKSLSTQTIAIGTGSAGLVEGENLLAVQLHRSGSGNAGYLSGTLALSGSPLVSPSDTWSYFHGVVEPSGGWFDTGLVEQVPLSQHWLSSEFDDSGWVAGPAPIGYDTSPHYQFATDVIAMRNTALSLFLRNKFSVAQAEIDASGDLQVTVDYDDAFVLYLNGSEVARGNIGVPGWNSPPFNQGANGSHGASNEGGGNDPEVIEVITVPKNLLRPGENVLCAQVHNAGRGSSDLLLDLTLATTGAGARALFADGDEWRYFIGSTAPIEVNDGESGPQLEFSDWIELYNDGVTEVDLDGWSLTDAADNPDKWVFPSVTIPSGGYLVVFASGADVLNPPDGSALHTSFRLRARGEYIGLYDAAGQLVHDFGGDFPPQDYFHSWGWDESEAATRYFAVPTPGGPNPPSSLEAFAAAPEISVESGHYTGGSLIEMTSPDPGATIRFTVDGTDPTETNGTDYTAPIDPSPNPTGGAVGRIDREVWINVPGSSVADIPVGTPPWTTSPMTRLNAIPDWVDQYGTRIRGFLHPPVGGDYTFWIASNDNGELWLSTDQSPSNKVRLAHVPGFTGYQQWDKYASQQSTPVTLTGGQKYYIEVLSKEDSGADNLSVAWQGPGIPMQIITSAQYLSPIVVPDNSRAEGTVLKARAFLPNGVASKVETRTYLRNFATGLQTLPSLLLSGNPENSIYDSNGALSIVGGTYSNGQWAPSNLDTDYNFAIKHGRTWERKATVEWLEPDTGFGFRTDFGLRVAGSPHARPRYTFNNMESNQWTGSWTNKPSFNFYFRDDFGAPVLDYPLVGEDRPARFDDLRLRAGKNDSNNPFIKDEFMRRLHVNMGRVAAKGRLVNLYVNGLYKGYFNLVERVREEFLRTHYDTSNGFDIWHIREIAEGDRSHYDVTMGLLANSSMAVPSNYEEISRRVDLANYIDYIIVNAWGGTGDWPHNNYIVARERTDPGPWRFYVWDAEGCCGGFGHDVNWNTFTEDLDSRTGHMSRAVYAACKESAEFRLLFADLIQRHFFHGGAMTQDNIRSVYTELRDELNPTMQVVRSQNVQEGWFNNWWGPRRSIFFSQLMSEGLWPSTRVPTLNQYGGAVAPGFALTMDNPNVGGTIYYTTDGRDPREPLTGAVGGTQFTGSIAINHSTVVKARVLYNDVWSPLLEMTFSTEVPPLVISELHYNSDGPSDDTEFIEILNVGSASVDLTGVHFSDGVEFSFAGGTLEPGEVIVVVEDQLAFETMYPSVPSAGVYTGGLDNGGETVTLSDIAGNQIYSVTYSGDAPWPTHPDGDGSSLVPVDPTNQTDPDDAANWTSSGYTGGTPGTIPAADFDSWISDHLDPASPDADPFADPDKDTGLNFIEFALGHQPMIADAPFAEVSLVDVDGEQFVAITFRERIASASVRIAVEVSSNLIDWTQATIEKGMPVINGDGTRTRTVRDTAPYDGAHRFFRLRVDLL